MKMNRWFALVVVIMIGFASGVFAQSPPPYGSPISLDVAKKVAAAAIDEAKKNNWVPVVVVVTDWSGSPVYLERMDGTLYAGVDVAIEKSRISRCLSTFDQGFCRSSCPGGPRESLLGLAACNASRGRVAHCDRWKTRGRNRRLRRYRAAGRTNRRSWVGRTQVSVLVSAKAKGACCALCLCRYRLSSD